MHEYANDNQRADTSKRGRDGGEQDAGDRSRAVFGQSRAVVDRLRESVGSASYDNAFARLSAARTKDETGTGGGGGDAGGGKAAEKKNLPIVVSKITAKKTLRSGLNPGSGAFGLMDPTFTFENVSHEVKDGKLHLTATLHCDYYWGVHSLGNTDVPSGTAKFITKDNYKEVADDIDPDLGTHPNMAAYQKYWSKAATEAHEKEHARDDWEDWGAKDTGVSVATKAWEGETVRSDQIEADLSKLQTAGGTKPRHPGKINSAVMAASDKHYGLPAAYEVRAGEVKAHAVGAKIERPLAKAVRDHGKKLEEQAKAEAKKKADAAKGGTTGGGDTGGGGGGGGIMDGIIEGATTGFAYGGIVGGLLGGIVGGISATMAPGGAEGGEDAPRNRKVDAIGKMF